MNTSITRAVATFALAVGVLGGGVATSLAVDNSPAGGDKTSKKDLEDQGYQCEVVATDFWECTKPGAKTWICSDRGRECVPKPMVVTPRPPRPVVVSTPRVAIPAR